MSERTGYMDPAAVLFDDSMDNSQSETGPFAFFFRRVERFKDSGQDIGSDSMALSETEIWAYSPPGTANPRTLRIC